MFSEPGVGLCNFSCVFYCPCFSKSQNWACPKVEVVVSKDTKGFYWYTRSHSETLITSRTVGSRVCRQYPFLGPKMKAINQFLIIIFIIMNLVYYAWKVKVTVLCGCPENHSLSLPSVLWCHWENNVPFAYKLSIPAAALCISLPCVRNPDWRTYNISEQWWMILLMYPSPPCIFATFFFFFH